MNTNEAAQTKRQIERLSAERVSLFSKANPTRDESIAARARLVAIERELDECYVALRRTRAEREAARFIAQDRFRRRIEPPRA